MEEQNSLVEIVQSHMASDVCELPVFSKTAMQIQQELIKKEPDLAIVDKIISSDQALSGQVLKIANSSFYRGLVEVTTIKSATARLGMREIGRIALLASAKDQFRSGDRALNLCMKKLWQHSVAVALSSHHIAIHTDRKKIAGEVFFAGLLHDVGKLFVLLALEQLKRRHEVLQVTETLVEDTAHILHSEQGYHLMKHWNLPQAYLIVARSHHSETFDTTNETLVIVRLADKLCTNLSIGLSEPEETPAWCTQEAAILGFTEVHVTAVESMLDRVPMFG